MKESALPFPRHGIGTFRMLSEYFGLFRTDSDVFSSAFVACPETRFVSPVFEHLCFPQESGLDDALLFQIGLTVDYYVAGVKFVFKLDGNGSSSE